MKRPFCTKLISLLLAFLPAFTPLGPVVWAESVPRAGNPTDVDKADNKVTLNFVNADIESVVSAIGSMTQRNFIMDARVRGQISLATNHPVSREEAYQLLLSTLRLQGFAVVENGSYSRVVPEADAKLQGGRVGVDTARSRGDQLITQIFRLNYESATNLLPVLRPLISPNNTITAYAANNTLVVTDYAENIQRLSRLIQNIDLPAGVDLDVIPLKHGVAVDMATVVGKLLDDTARGSSGDAGQRVTLLADQRTNSILLRAASRTRADLARSLITRLDQPTQGTGNIWVVYLKNAEATKLAQTLRGIVNGESTPLSTSNSTPSSTSNAPATSSSSTSNSASGNTSNTSSWTNNAPATTMGGMIQADPSTNSLIITAPEPVYRNVRDIIEKLDVRRAQVFIESLIVEMSADKAAEFGVQWFGGGTAGSATIVGGQLLGGTGSNLLSIAQNPASIGNGFSLGIAGRKLNLPGIGEVTSLGFLARALETQGAANVLSTPNLLTLDNEEAKIVVGQNVPFITGQYTNTGSGTGAAVSPFQTIERKDVGITLRVRPQVSDGGVVKLQVFQEVSSVADLTSAAGVITNKRSIESNVIVDDGQIIVLGGLIEDRSGNKQEKVPGLGDIPGLGNLFRYDTRKQNKTNLMVFLRPVVIRDANNTHSVVLDRYEYMRSLSQEAQPASHWVLPQYNPPMPALLNEQQTVAPNRSLIETSPTDKP